MNSTDSRLPAALEAALRHVTDTAAAVAERVATGMGAQSQSATRIAERDLMLSMHIELRRNMGSLNLTFNEVLGTKVREDTAPRGGARRKQAATNWQTLSLVEDREIEERMFSERIGQQISHACEAELRDMAAYMGTVIGLGRADEDRNPLRPDIIGMATYRAIEAATDDPEGRKLLAREFGLTMAQAMPDCYAAIVGNLQSRGVKPVSLTLKTVDGPGNLLPGYHSGYDSLREDAQPSGAHATDLEDDLEDAQEHEQARDSGTRRPSAGKGKGVAARGAARTEAAGLRAPVHRASAHKGQAFDERGPGSTSDAELMNLLRRLTFLASRPGDLQAAAAAASSAGGFRPSGRSRSDAIGFTSRARPGPNEGRRGRGQTTGGSPLSGGDTERVGYGEDMTGLMAVNLIRAHREELLQASTGKLDHMVIDVVGSLFDQILSDSRVPPQMARQIARLQLPVLRVALVDASFFSSRRHPVRRFVNRIASLACAFEDFDAGPGKQFLERVRELVQEIVEGDFDQVDLYSAKLGSLEAFIASQTQVEAKTNGAASLLEGKESELRIQQRYMLQLQQALTPVPMHAYLRDFLSQVWSQALVLTARSPGADVTRARRLRQVGVELVMSVQPKGSLPMRKRFLMQLPGLMKDLNEGLKLIGWPDAAQKEFFGKLLPSHAESLKTPAISELDYNMLVKQLEAIFAAGVPGQDDLSRSDPLPEMPEAQIEQRFSATEAKQVGLIAESAIDWAGKLDIDLGFDTADTPADTHGDSDSGPTAIEHGLDINLDLVAADSSIAAHGAALMDHVRVGFAYQMHLKDSWQKVRLSYVSPARGFFVFTHGRTQQETVSLTSRMLARMCETGRLRAVESAYLMERATTRARKQLAALKLPSQL